LTASPLRHKAVKTYPDILKKIAKASEFVTFQKEDSSLSLHQKAFFQQQN
jgi:hypothetical protein